VSSSAVAIPLVDVRAGHAEIADAVREGFERVLDSSIFVLGPEVSAFEEEFARFVGCRCCIAVSNGTDALELALRAAGVGAGDEVLVPVNTFVATALAVVRAGAKPVFVDCESEHLLIDERAIEPLLTPRTKAIIPVHLYGQMTAMGPILEVADGRGLHVIEDFAQAQGARQGSRAAGAIGSLGATSFYPAKNLGAYGDAGAVVTSDPDLAESLRGLRNHGGTRKHHHPRAGFNCRMDALQAVVLRAKLKLLAGWNALRRDAAGRYDRLLRDLAPARAVARLPGNEHVYHLYVLKLEGRSIDRDRIVQRFHESGIEAAIHYPTPLHLTGAFSGLGYRRGDFPVAEKVAGRILSLPIFPQITADQQERVVACLRRTLSS